MLSTHTYFWGKVLDAKLGGGNNNKCRFEGLANFEKAKASIFVNINLYCIRSHFS